MGERIWWRRAVIQERDKNTAGSRQAKHIRHTGVEKNAALHLFGEHDFFFFSNATLLFPRAQTAGGGGGDLLNKSTKQYETKSHILDSYSNPDAPIRFRLGFSRRAASGIPISVLPCGIIRCHQCFSGMIRE